MMPKSQNSGARKTPWRRPLLGLSNTFSEQQIRALQGVDETKFGHGSRKQE
jgi:hypothetical protein